MVPLKAVDVAVGVAFFYLLLTFGASAVLELIANTLNWRAQMLHDAIKNMLDKSFLVTVENIYGNPQVLALFRKDAAPSRIDLFERFGWHESQGGTPPSYIPAATFSGAVLEGLMNKALSQKVVQSLDLSPPGAIKLINDLLNAPPPAGCVCAATATKEDALRSLLETTLVTQGSSIQAVRFAIEKWFNDTMDRASGWYKRRTQACLLMIGVLLALGCNLNTIAVVRWLWQGDTARQAAVSAAADFVRKTPPTPEKPGDKKSDGIVNTNDGVIAARILDIDQQIGALHYPIGWYGFSGRGISVFWVLSYIAGAIITGLAISMGSTFWFDAVQSLLKIRGAGPKPSR
jgi:hypothetical protein